MRRKLLILALLLFFAASAHAASTWKLVYGPAEVNNTKDYQDIVATSVSTAFAMGDQTSGGKTSDYGQTWTTTVSAGSVWKFYKASFATDLIYCTAGTRTDSNKAMIARSTDGGVSGAVVKSYSAEGDQLYSVFFYDSNNGWACGAGLGTGTNGGAVTKTTDGGATWGSEAGWDSETKAGVGRDLWFTSATNGVVVGDHMSGAGITEYFGIVRTTDGGATWTAATVPTAATYHHKNLYGVCFADANTGWAVGEGATVLMTTDGGANWSALSTSGVISATATIAAVTAVDDQHVWVGGYNSDGTGFVVKTANGGSTWTSDGSITGQRLRGISFIDLYNGYAAGSQNSDSNSVVYKYVTDPTVSSVYQTGTAIAAIPQGFAGNIDINGINVLEAPTFDAMSDITINSVTWVNNTQVRLNVTASDGATAGNRNVVMNNPDTGVSAAFAVLVTERPRITLVDPNSKTQGWSGDVVITGTSFSTNCAVSFGSEIQVLNTVNNSTTQVTVTISIPQSATVGNHTITLTNTDNGVGAATFAVTAAVNPPTISGVEFNSRPYVASSAAYPIQNINRSPTVKFNFYAGATETVSRSAFKIYARDDGIFATYSIPSSYYVGTDSSGTVTYDIGPLNPGIVTITVYGEDTKGQGASAACTVNVLDPNLATETVNLVPYPNPYNGTGPITTQITSDSDLGECSLNFVSSSGERLGLVACTIYAGSNKIIWTPSREVPNGIVGMALLKDGAIVKNGGRGKLVVYR